MQQDILTRAERLGAVGGLTYYRLDAVIAQDGRGELRYHCAPAEWDASPAAAAVRESARIDAEMARLHAQLDALAAERERSAGALPMPAAPVAPSPAPFASVVLPPCPHCGKDGFQRAAGRSAHVRHCERAAALAQAGPAPITPARPYPTKGIRADRTIRDAARALYDDRPSAYTCPRCKSQAFAKSVNADHCQKCARDLSSAPDPAFGTGMQILNLDGRPVEEQPA